MIQSRLPDEVHDAVRAAMVSLGAPMVVRSSAIVEGDGEWAGAFTSYLEINPDEIETAVVGCWASAFTVDALSRCRATGHAPGSVAMAVLVQPAIIPDVGGTARIVGGEVVVEAVAGSPSSLVQGWEPGVHARVDEGGSVVSGAARDLVGTERLGRVADMARTAYGRLGANSFEWAAVGEAVHLLQLMRSMEAVATGMVIPDALRSPAAIDVARAARRAPGPLGEALVLPWAAAHPDLLMGAGEPIDVEPGEALQLAIAHSALLTSEAWGGGLDEATTVLRHARGNDSSRALATIASLRRPDPTRARMVLGLVARVRFGLAAVGAVSRPDLGWYVDPGAAGEILIRGRGNPPLTRAGRDRWEPFDVGVVMANGRRIRARPAASGIGAGRMCLVGDAGEAADFRPRDVLVGIHPVPNLAPLLWDASALVTAGGGPGAHLFESARALGIPAVCGARLDEVLGMDAASADGRFAIAVSGDDGTVAAMEW
jgi:hypothetical protein